MKIKTFFKYNFNIFNWQNKKHGPFCLYEYQKDFIKKLDKHQFNYLVQDRQMGSSITIGGYMIYSAIKNPNSFILAVCPSSGMRDGFKEKLQEIYGKKLPYNIEIIKYDQNSKGNQYSDHDVYIMDACFMKNFDLGNFCIQYKINPNNKLCITTLISELNPELIKQTITTYWPYVLNENYNTNWANEMVHSIGQESFKTEYYGGYSLHRPLQTNAG